MTHDRYDSRSSIVAAILLSFIATGGFLILPLLVAAAAADFQLSEARVGLLATAVMGGAAVSSAVALLWIRLVNWRRATLVSVLLILAGHIGCLFTSRADVLTVLLLLTGLGGGAAYSIALTVLADEPKAARYFGFSVAAQVSFQVVGMLLLPAFTEAHGFAAVLVLLLVLDVVGLFLSALLPPRGLLSPQRVRHGPLLRVPAVLALLGCFMFFFNVGAVWAFIERMGSAAGLAPDFIGLSLAVGVSFGIPGALAGSWCDDRFGQIVPLTLGSVIMLGSIALLSMSLTGPAYMVALALYNFSWNFCLTFQYAAVQRVDDSGRGVAVAPAFHGFGAAAGPLIAALYVTRESYQSVLILAIVGIVGSLLLFVIAWQRGTSRPATVAC
ncbi:MFS transporter [Parahaliea mediterranea]|uniref:MFS transporter n=1 Tax=Parahaliea mediterranea TaxID=651086 RepID=UPI001300A6C5|nr:MFS transporter [Parahaliea mediterranea]